MNDASTIEIPQVLATGIDGLDDVLHGGLTADRMYLVEGQPGSGKTTLALQFLIEGAQRGERCLLVTLSESRAELLATAEGHGWSLEGIDILEIATTDEALEQDSRYTMYHPSEVELARTTRSVLAEAERLRPQRMVLDSLVEFRLLAENPLRYRRQILALKQYFSRQSSTVLFVNDVSSDVGDMRLHSLVHGVVVLEHVSPDFGVMRRRLQVVKQRGRRFREGWHDYVIQRGGLEVFPRLVASEHHDGFERGDVASGVPALDEMLGGGLARGTSTLLIGQAGTGKSSVATRYSLQAAGRGECALVYLFDESRATFLARASGLGMELADAVESGHILLRQIDPAEMTPGEFAHTVRRDVEAQDARIVVLDSLNGYMNAMPNERFLMLHMHELLTYLGQRGVTTLLLLAQHGGVGSEVRTPFDASYLADTVLLLRFFESRGAVRKAIATVKKRTGAHERTIRELALGAGTGIEVGEPLRDFEGVLYGSPRLADGANG